MNNGVGVSLRKMKYALAEGLWIKIMIYVWDLLRFGCRVYKSKVNRIITLTLEMMFSIISNNLNILKS